MVLIKPNIVSQIYYNLFLALAIVLPIHGRLVPPVIALIGLVWLLEFNFITKYNRIRKSRKRKSIALFGVFYLLYLLGTLYSEQLSGMEGAWFDLEVKLSLLVFPLLFSTIDFSSFKNDFYPKLLKAFLLGCLVSCMFLINNAVFNYFTYNDESLLYYTNLSQMHHPSYLALYITFAIAIILVKLVVNNPDNSTKWLFGIILIILFQVFIVLLSSKAGIIGLALTYILAILFSIFMGKKIFSRTLVLSLSLLIALMITISSIPYSYNRLYSAKQVVESSEEINVTADEGTASRILIWSTSVKVIKENFFFGVGTGDVKQSLMDKYKEQGITQAYHDHLNAHNQYLQTFIALGLFGFLVLLAGFVLPAIFSFKHNNMLYFLFLGMIGFHLLVESMFERQAGVVFYGFLNVVLFYFTVSEEKSNPQLP